MNRTRGAHRRAWKVLWIFAAIFFVTSAFMPFAAFAQEKQAEKEEPQEQPAPQVVAESHESDRNLREKRYFYQAFGRRDPFRSLIVGEFEEAELDLVDIYAVKLVGVLSGGMEKFAMLEDKNGYGYILKAGDPIRNGSIVSVTDETILARVTMFGQTNSIMLRMDSGKEKGE